MRQHFWPTIIFAAILGSLSYGVCYALYLMACWRGVE